MTNHQPWISIITVVYNGQQHIEPTIQSVIMQTFDNYEYLIIDGQSTDNTLNIVRQHSQTLDLILSEPDKGVYDAMNKGLNLAKGEYILFLNAGDELASPTLLEELFSGHESPDLIYGETLIISPERKILGTRTALTSRKLPSTLSKKDFLNGQVVSHQSFIPRRSISPNYNLKYLCSADIEWQLTIIERSQKIMRAEQPISKYLQGGISDTQLSKCWKERFLILLKHFTPLNVLLAHFNFIYRYIRIGSYRS